MGVLNITPDSFSDGGSLFRDGTADLDAVDAVARQMLAQGADILDIGGESTRPGAAPVDAEQECQRVVPVIRELANCGAVLSIDTRHASVARAALEAGAHLVNDISAGAERDMLPVVAAAGAGYALMHMQGEPATMQREPRYGEVVAEVGDYLRRRYEACLRAGIDEQCIALDPGIGFGKTAQHNLALLRDLEALRTAQRPLLVGVSRKSMLGKITGRTVDQRMVASVTAAVLAAQGGANILRVHDVGATRDGLKVLAAWTSGDAATAYEQ